MSKVPKWAEELVAQVRKDYKIDKKLVLKWRRTHRKWTLDSSGSNQGELIRINAGPSRKDLKLVLLHEIAHWIRPDEENHSKEFWDLAFDLYWRYGVPMRYAFNREKSYRKEAIYAYYRNKMKRRINQQIKLIHKK